MLAHRRVRTKSSLVLHDIGLDRSRKNERALSIPSMIHDDVCIFLSQGYLLFAVSIVETRRRKPRLCCVLSSLAVESMRHARYPVECICMSKTTQMEGRQDVKLEEEGHSMEWYAGIIVGRSYTTIGFRSRLCTQIYSDLIHRRSRMLECFKRLFEGDDICWKLWKDPFENCTVDTRCIRRRFNRVVCNDISVSVNQGAESKVDHSYTL